MEKQNLGINYTWNFAVLPHALSVSPSTHSPLYLFPLVDVADEAGESQEAEQTEYLGEAHNAEGSGSAVHVRRLVPGLQVHNKEDVVDGDGRDKVHYEPGAQVVHADLFGVQYDVAVLPCDARTEIEHQVHEEEGVGQDVEGDPRHGVLVFEEGDPPGQDDQVAHHQHEHHNVPVKSEKEVWSGIHINYWISVVVGLGGSEYVSHITYLHI